MPAADAAPAGHRRIRRPVREPPRRRPRRAAPARPADRAVRDRRPAERDPPRLAVRGAGRRRCAPPAPGELVRRLPEPDGHRHRRRPERRDGRRSRIRAGSIPGSHGRPSGSRTAAARSSPTSAGATDGPARASDRRLAPRRGFAGTRGLERRRRALDRVPCDVQPLLRDRVAALEPRHARPGTRPRTGGWPRDAPPDPPRSGRRDRTADPSGGGPGGRGRAARRAGADP